MFGKDDTHFVPYGEDGCLQRQDLTVILGRHYTNVIDHQLSLSTTNGTYYADSVAWVKEIDISHAECYDMHRIKCIQFLRMYTKAYRRRKGK